MCVLLQTRPWKRHKSLYFYRCIYIYFISTTYFYCCLLKLHTKQKEKQHDLLSVFIQNPIPVWKQMFRQEREAHKDGEEGAPQESSTCNLFCLFASVNAVVMKYWCSLPNCLVSRLRSFRLSICSTWGRGRERLAVRRDELKLSAAGCQMRHILFKSRHKSKLPLLLYRCLFLYLCRCSSISIFLSLFVFLP